MLNLFSSNNENRREKEEEGVKKKQERKRTSKEGERENIKGEREKRKRRRGEILFFQDLSKTPLLPFSRTKHSSELFKDIQFQLSLAVLTI